MNKMNWKMLIKSYLSTQNHLQIVGKPLINLLLSVIVGICTSFAFINYLPRLWGKYLSTKYFLAWLAPIYTVLEGSRIVQGILIAVLAVFVSALYYFIIMPRILLAIKAERKISIFSWLMVSVWLARVLMSNFNIPLPIDQKAVQKLEIISSPIEAENNSRIIVVEVKINKRKIPIKSFDRGEGWEIQGGKLINSVQNQEGITYFFKNEPQSQIDVLFEKGTALGPASIVVNGKEEVRQSLKDADSGERLVEIITYGIAGPLWLVILINLVYAVVLLTAIFSIGVFLKHPINQIFTSLCAILKPMLNQFFASRLGHFFTSRNVFIFSIVIVILAFLIPRLPWFVDYPLPVIQPDTKSYFVPVKQIFSGELPILNSRTFGYPLFLSLVFLFSPKLYSVVIIQCLLSLMSALFFIWAVYKTYPYLTLSAAFAMIAHLTQPLLFSHDFALLTESLYASTIIFFLGFFLLAVHFRRSLFFIIISILGGYLIFIRPSGVFIIGIIIITLIYIIVNKYPWVSIISLLIPLSSLILMQFTYNYFTVGYFGLTAYSSLQFYDITAPYWEIDASFPKEINDGIVTFQEGISSFDRHIIEESWDPSLLQGIYVYHSVRALRSFPLSVYSIPGNYSALDRELLASKVAKKAIISNPQMYIKSIWFTLRAFVLDESSWHVLPYIDLDKYYEFLGRITYKDAYHNFILKEYIKLPLVNGLRIVYNPMIQDVDAVFLPTGLYNIYSIVNNFLSRLFDHEIWLYLYLITIIYTTYKIIITKFLNQNIFILFIFGLVLLFAGVVVSMSAYISNRYPSPTRFIEYLVVFMLPLLFMKTPFRSQD